MSKMTRLREYAATHGIGYTIRRIGEKAGQVVLGTWDREWKREQPDEEELERQRRHPPQAGLISIVIPVYNTKERFLRELTESLKAQTYERWEAILYDGKSDRAETTRDCRKGCNGCGIQRFKGLCAYADPKRAGAPSPSLVPYEPEGGNA